MAHSNFMTLFSMPCKVVFQQNIIIRARVKPLSFNKRFINIKKNYALKTKCYSFFNGYKYNNDMPFNNSKREFIEPTLVKISILGE